MPNGLARAISKPSVLAALALLVAAGPSRAELVELQVRHRQPFAGGKAFGQTGPYRSRPGYDVVAQGESGLMDLTGFPDGPPAKVGTSISDIVTGLFATQGILPGMTDADIKSQSGRGDDCHKRGHGLKEDTVSHFTASNL